MSTMYDDGYRVKIYVINLDKDVDRWESISKVLEQNYTYEHERFPAIYGSDLTEAEKKQQTTEWCSDHCTDGMIGCALSHIKVWEKAVADDVDYAVILEDDIVLRDDYEDILKQYLSPKTNAELILFGCQNGCDADTSNNIWLHSNFSALYMMEKISRGRPPPLGRATRMLNPEASKGEPVPVEEMMGSHAYALDRKGLQQMCSAQGGLASYHIDVSISYNGLRAVKVPAIGGQSDEFVSNNSKSGAYSVGHYLNFPYAQYWGIKVNLKAIIIFLLLIIGGAGMYLSRWWKKPKK